MPDKYVIGLDYGTNSVRALLVNAATGEEVATSVFHYPTGDAGIILDPKDPDLARQNPADYLAGAEATVKAVLADAAAAKPGFSPHDVIGIGVDTTGSTPLPVDEKGVPLAFDTRFGGNPAAMAWLWKDHTGHAEADQVTGLCLRMRVNYIRRCGGRYSSEWFWSKLLHCARTAPDVWDAAYTWVECADWIPAVLTGTTAPGEIKRCICAAGHKALASPEWGGYPDAEFLGALDPKLVRIGETLPKTLYDVADTAGGLTAEWAAKLGLKEGTPVAVGAFDAHLGAVGCGVGPGSLVKILGTSSCDIMTHPLSGDLPDIPGLCGIVPESVLPDHWGLEAGQSAMGDIYNWFVSVVKPGGQSHQQLTEAAARLKPGESGLLALDWHNGNRTVLVDQRLSGLILGLSLHSTPAEIYRALIEATAFGSRAIIERFEEYGVHVERVINAGGIAAKNATLMQIYADVLNRPMLVSRSEQTCALGSAICGAVVAGKAAGGYDSFADAIQEMTDLREQRFIPRPEAAATYGRLYVLYRQLHDAFGIAGTTRDISNVMKDLLSIRDEVRGA